jgi:hypothetical protein
MLRYKALENMKQNTDGLILRKPLKNSVEEVTGSKMAAVSETKDVTTPLPNISRELTLKRESKPNHTPHTHNTITFQNMIFTTLQ